MGPVLNMSNYRVRQVLALGAMPERQLRFLVALATWMSDHTRMVRVGFDALITDTGKSHNTVRTARRELESAGKLTSTVGRGAGNLTVWVVLCLPETAGKGTSEVGTFNGEPKGTSEVGTFNGEPKGTNPDPEKVPTEAAKRYQRESADLQEPDRGLNSRAKPSGSLLSPRARDVARPASAGAPERGERIGDVIAGKIVPPSAARPSLAEEIAQAVGVSVAEAQGLIEHVRLDPKVDRPSAWLRKALSNGTIAELYADLDSAAKVRAEMFSGTWAGPPSGPPAGTGARQPWCGKCREQTRQREDDDGRPYRCPECHPRAASPAGGRQ